jgi:GNAT superfamily N-acetyltransferase
LIARFLSFFQVASMIKATNTVTPEQIATMHGIHKRALPDDITPNLPSSYYAKIARLIADSSNGFVVRADDVGFCWVAYHPEDVSKKIGAYRSDLARALVGFALTKPALLLDLYGSMRGKVEYHETVEPCPEVYCIAVDEGRRSSGLGRAMMESTISRLATEGHRALLVKTASPQALRFYLREGFREIGVQKRGRRLLSILHRPL